MSQPLKRKRSRHEPNRFSLSHEGGPKYFEIVDSEDVLIVEDSLQRILTFRKWLRRARLSPTADHAIAAIRQRMPTTVFLDRDLSGPSFGEEIATFLTAEKFSGRVIITSTNPFGVQVISEILSHAGIQFEAVPFSILGIVRAPARDSR